MSNGKRRNRLEDFPFDAEEITREEAHEQLETLRRKTGTRKSIYLPLLGVCEGLPADRSLALTVPSKKVGALRSYLYRHVGKEKLSITSARIDPNKDLYRVFILKEEE